MPWITRKLTVDTPQRVDRSVSLICEVSRSELRGLFDHDCVSVNGMPCENMLTELQPGDEVTLRYDDGQRYHPKPREWKDSAFRILHEDEQLLVVDKAPWILTVPTEANEPQTLMNRIGKYLGRGGKTRDAFPVHRLDRGVGGLLIVARDPEIARQLRSQFEERKPMRLYLAIVRGRIEPAEATIRTYLSTRDDLSRFSTLDPELGQLAITRYQRLDVAADASLLRVQLQTGRRNQIRVHLSERSHPVLGDPRYARKLASHPQWRAAQLALHAIALTFTHPATQREMTFTTPVPPPFQRFWPRSIDKLLINAPAFQSPEAPVDADTRSASDRFSSPTEKRSPSAGKQRSTGGQAPSSSPREVFDETAGESMRTFRRRGSAHQPTPPDKFTQPPTSARAAARPKRKP